MTILTRTVAAVAVVAIAALIGYQVSNLDDNVGDSPSPIPSPSAAPSTSTAPSAPQSLEPSAEPSAAALVVRMLGGGEAGRVHLVTILDDGRVITSDPFGASPPVERRLTAEGIQLVRDELDATGLTETSADYPPVPNPGTEPPAYGGAGPSLEVGQPGGGTAIITWFLFGETEEDYFQPQPEAEALEVLADRLATLDDWLPADAWEDAIGSPYVASGYRMTIAYQQWGGSPDALPVESDTVSWPLDEAMDAFGAVINPPPEEVRCGLADGEDGRRVIAALEEAGATMGGLTGSSYELGERATSRLVTITLEPILPFDETSC